MWKQDFWTQKEGQPRPLTMKKANEIKKVEKLKVEGDRVPRDPEYLRKTSRIHCVRM